jgi:hypothetical protein
MAGSGIFGGILIILFGIVNCFFGYVYFRLLLGVWGFFMGGALGISLASDGAPIVVLAAGLIGAIIGALLIYLLFRVGVLLIGALLGYALTAALLAALGINENIFVLSLGGAATFALLALFMNRVFIIVLTAFSGASAIITGVSLLLDAERITRAFAERRFAPVSAETPLIVGVFWLLLAVAGIIIQYRSLDDDR